MKREQWNQSQRMQIKVLICVLGLLLLFLLLAAKVLFPLLNRERGTGIEPHIPLVEKLSNVWIMEADEEKLKVFCEGKQETLYYADKAEVWENGRALEGAEKALREQIADICLTDGRVTELEIKSQKLHGRVLSADESGVELEGLGRLLLAADYKGYRIYNTLEMCRAKDLIFGYDFADFVMEDGEIAAILQAKDEAMESIRILIKASDYSSLLHDEVVLTADSDFTLQYGAGNHPKTREYAAGEEAVIGRDSEYLSEGRLRVLPQVVTGKIILKSVNRSQGIPAYRGSMELVAFEDGIAVINEVTLEEYLYSVVPSEMPSSYPKEALKAQAVCARTYAYGHMLHAGYPEYGAHVDDSTSYQVYNNILEQETTTTAVKETYGQLLYLLEGGLAETYYYSTSCGVGTDANVWKSEAAQAITYLQPKEISQRVMEAESLGEEGESEHFAEALREEENFAEFITSVREEDFEAAEGWYRWSYQVEELDREYMLAMLQKRYGANEKLVLTLENGEYVSKPIEELEEILDISIEKRGMGGVSDELIIQTKKQTYKVISEHNIRYLLKNGENKIIRQDGSKIDCPSLLPSGFFIIETVKKEDEVMGYLLTGGGFGHGVGMSQNGAGRMAEKGYTAEQILLFFYEKCCIKNIYE